MSKKRGADFQTIKQRVKLLDVLGYYGITPNLKQKGHVYIGKCPLHGGSRHGQFRVDTEKGIGGVFYCFGDCDTGGGVLEFVQLMEGIDIHAAGLKIWKEIFPDRFESIADTPEKPRESAKKKSTTKSPPEHKAENKKAEPAQKPEETETDVIIKPLGFPLQNLETQHPYFQTRNLDDEVIETFALAHYSGKGMMKERVVIPIHDPQGQFIVGYAGRAIDEATEPRYLFPPKFPKAHLVYNLHRAAEMVKDNPNLPIILTEGFFDTIHLHRCGYPAVALMGSALIEPPTGNQKELLIQTHDKYIVLMDGDEKGRLAAQKIANQLVTDVFIKVIPLPCISPEKFQPEHFTPDELSWMLKI